MNKEQTILVVNRLRSVGGEIDRAFTAVMTAHKEVLNNLTEVAHTIANDTEAQDLHQQIEAIGSIVSARRDRSIEEMDKTTTDRERAKYFYFRQAFQEVLTVIDAVSMGKPVPESKLLPPWKPQS